MEFGCRGEPPKMRVSEGRRTTRERSAPPTEHIVRMDDETEPCGQKEGAGGSDAEGQRDNRGKRGNESGKWERLHDFGLRR